MPPDDELTFLRWLQETDLHHRGVTVPLGDDAAVVEWAGAEVVVAADAIAEGTHFLSGDDPHLVGRKALAVNLSDLAAMGAEPVLAVATATLPRGFNLSQAQAMTEGMRQLGHEHGCPIVGGDTTTHDGGVVLSVTAIGRLMGAAPVRRTGAEPGYVVMVTGAIGGSRKGTHLSFEPRLREARCLVDATSRLSMIDVSDGLLLDLTRITPGFGFRLQAERIPLSKNAGDLDAALAEGEDFELLMAMHPDDAPRVLAEWSLDTPLSEIGEVTESGHVLIEGGVERPVAPRGFRHE